MLWVLGLITAAGAAVAILGHRFTQHVNGTLAILHNDDPERPIIMRESDLCWSCDALPAETTNDLGLCSGCRAGLIPQIPQS